MGHVLMRLRKRNWNEMSSRERAVTVFLAVVQLTLAIAAWRDLARRPSELVNGSKLKWAVIIGINFVGPIMYFAKGRVSMEEVTLYE